jgi:hypothetical protein
VPLRAGAEFERCHLQFREGFCVYTALAIERRDALDAWAAAIERCAGLER